MKACKLLQKSEDLLQFSERSQRVAAATSHVTPSLTGFARQLSRSLNLNDILKRLILSIQAGISLR